MYTNRFSSQLGWQKILFRPDRKLQSAELNELQSLINYQQTQAWDYLLYTYQIVRGLRITVKGFSSQGYIFNVSSGQVFIRQQDTSFFLDIPDSTINVPYSTRVSLVIKLTFTEITNEDYLRDPIIGGELCGELGADRYKITPELVLNQDGYPIATILTRQLEQHPYIFYYTKEGYSLQYNSQYISSIISDYLALRLFEESGDFIATGLELSLTSNNTVTISPGLAYIKGSPVRIEYPYSFRITQDTTSVYLDNKGFIYTNPQVKYKNSNSIYLGLIQKENGVYNTINSNSRPLYNSDLQLLRSQVSSVRDSITDFLLLTETLTQIDTQSSGIITESFINTKGSDIYSLLFNATLVPKYKLLRPGLKSNNLGFSNFTLVDSSNISNSSKLIHPTFSESPILSQLRATSFISISDVQRVPTLKVSPPNGLPNTETKEYNSVSDIEISNANYLDTFNSNVAKIVSNLSTTEVTLEGFGFNTFEDNLSIVFGNIKITEFDILKGSLGTQASTIKTSEDGSFSLVFNVPANLPFKQYIISVSNSTTSATVPFRDIASDNIVLDYKANIAQSFTISSPIIISKINLAIRQVPSLPPISDLAIVSVVKVVNDLPSTSVIGQAILSLSDVATSSDGSVLTEISFETPLTLPSSGSYAIVISPLSNRQPLEFFYAEVGSRSINSLSISDVQPLSGGELLIFKDNKWIRELSKDLTFQLIQAVPNANVSEITYRITNPLGKINFLKRSIAEIINPFSKIEYFYKNNSGELTVLKENQYIPQDLSEMEVVIRFSGTSNLFSLIKVQESCFTIHEDLTESTWVSRVYSYDSPYRNVEIELGEYYEPTGTEIIVFFSSNGGETWQKIDRTQSTLVNNNIPLYKGNWTAINIEPTTVSTDITGNTSRILRTKISIRIDFTTKNKGIVPYCRKLKAIVY